jgi:replicative DNA helicase
MALSLAARHVEELKASALDAAIIAERGYRTVSDPHELPEAFADYQRRPGLLMPIRDVSGDIVSWQLKPDIPRFAKGGKPIKYETAAGGRQCLDVPQRARSHLRDPAIELVVTEGVKKVDSALSHHIPCVIGKGVYGFRGKNELGGIVALPDWETIALNDREVLIALDSDCMTKDSVRDGLDRLGALLQQRRARVRYVVMPDLPDGSKCGLDDWFASGRTVQDLNTCVRESLPPAQWDWHEPMPLDDMVGPPFPVEQLPGSIGAYVEAVAEETQTPSDLPANVALGTISAAAGGKYEVVIPTQGWREPIHIQAVAVAEPGHRKSALFRRITAPIGEYERTVQPEERKAYAEWESRRRMLENRRTDAEKAVNKPPKDGKVPVSDGVRIDAVTALEAHTAARPRITRLIVDDATSEAVKGLLAEQGGAIAVMSAESAFLSNTAGARYGDSPNLDVLLNGHAGDAIRVNRRGRPEEIIDRACLTLCLMVQPQVIRDLGNVTGFIARGAAARLLPCFPVDLLGRRRIDVTPVPTGLATAWERVVTRIVERVPAMQDGSYVPWTLSLDAEALALFHEYRAWHEPHMGKDGAFADIRDWAGKQCGVVLRIAGLLHIASQSDRRREPECDPVPADTLRRAIAITGYYEQHARIMYRVMLGRSNHADARVMLAALRTLDEPMTRRDLHRKLHNRMVFASSADLSAPLDLLEDYGWIKRERKGSDKGGRPSERIFLSPFAKDDKSDKTRENMTGERGSVGFVIDFPETETVSRRPGDPFERDGGDLGEAGDWPDDDDPFANLYEAV